MAVYSMQCPMCPTVLSVDAMDDGEAMMKMKEGGKKHMMDMHKDAPPMSDADMETMIKGRWKKS